MKLLVVDDDPSVSDALRLSLAFQRDRFQLRAVADGRSALHVFFEWQPDIVLLDIGLPDLDGLGLLSRIRECSTTRVIMISGRSGDVNIAKALELGADDYVTKPFSLPELIARLRSHARRAAQEAETAGSSEMFNADGLSIHFPTREVRVNGRKVALTSTEYGLLYQLVQNAGRLMSCRSLLQLVWGSEDYGTDVVRVYISRLRSKIEPEPNKLRYIFTKPGLGYVFDAGADQEPEQPSDVSAPTADVVRV